MKRIVSILFLVLLLSSCEEPFTVDVGEQTSFLVFEGEITNIDTFQVVRIYKSMSFNETGNFETVTGFHVNIEDKEGTIYPLIEKSSGVYYTLEKVQGEINHEYRMVAYDDSNRVYMSSYQRMFPVPEITNLSGDYKVETEITKNEGTSYTETTTDGIEIYATTTINDSTPYFKFDFNTVFLSLQVYPTGPPFNTTYYVARPANSWDYGNVVAANGNDYANNIIKELPIYFFTRTKMETKFTILSFEYDEETDSYLYPDDEITITSNGFLLQVEQRSLTKEGYEFWNAVQNQLNASGKLFDPLETEIEGNISCVDDESEYVFGYFGASAVSFINNHFYLRFDNVAIKNEIDYFPMLDSVNYSRSIFDYWVN